MEQTDDRIGRMQGTLSAHTVLKMMSEGEIVPLDKVYIVKVCSICDGRYGERVRSDDPHLVNVLTGTIHVYGEWADETACGRDCTGPNWMHKV